MNRFSFVLNLEPGKTGDLYPHFRNAFLACLSQEELCAALDLMFKQESDLRQAIIDQIRNGMVNKFLGCHEQLVETLLHLVTQKRCSQRQLIAFCLDEITEATPHHFQDRIVQVFLDAPHKSIRKRGFNRLHQNWDKRFEVQVATIWFEHHDLLATKLIIEKFPSEFLQEHFVMLDTDIEKYHQTRSLLYKRTCPMSKEYLTKLAQHDGITYAYISAKIGVVFSEDEAQQLVHQYAEDNRLGILVWALGVMQHWEVLEKMYRNVSSMVRQL